MPPSRILPLGVIGPGPDWESRYAPALAKLAHRVRIARVYDAQWSRAEHVAASCGASASSGVRRLLDAPELSAVLVLDAGWSGDWLLPMLMKLDRPVLIGRHVLSEQHGTSLLRQPHPEVGSTMVPETWLRYQPSLLRLRELLATKLGSPGDVRFDLTRARHTVDPQLTLADLLNWFRTTFDIVTAGVNVKAESEHGGGSKKMNGVVLSAPTRKGGTIRLHLSPAAESDGLPSAPAEPQPFCTVTCDSGSVDLLGRRDLRWRADAEEASESLASDRSATDVVLDLFARRVAGGLIPVPSLADLHQARRLADLVAAVTERGS